MLGVMPTENGNTKLLVDHETLIAWFKERWADQSCPICGHSSWILQPTALRLDKYAFDGQDIGFPYMAAIPVTCKNCAYVLFFDGFEIPGAIKVYGTESDDE